jgi:hypothetical protein
MLLNDRLEAVRLRPSLSGGVECNYKPLKACPPLSPLASAASSLASTRESHDSDRTTFATKSAKTALMHRSKEHPYTVNSSDAEE